MIAIKIEEGDELIEADLTDGSDQLVLITQDGMSLRFTRAQLRGRGRRPVGVRGIRLQDGRLSWWRWWWSIWRRRCWSRARIGIGKRTPFDEYLCSGRGGVGVITMKTGDKPGQVVERPDA